MKTIKLLCLIVFVIWSSPLHATTLLDADWATGTGCGCTAAADGIWSVCTQTIGECSFEVKTGGYGGRNQLSFNFDGVNNHLRANSPSMGGPSTAYIRFWFRRNSVCDGQIHPMYISSGTAVDSGFAPIREYESGSTFSIIPNVYQADPSGGYFYYTGTVSIGTWYRLEYKVENGGTSSGSITVRLDGVDITSSMRTAGGTYLSAANGSLTLQALNYVNFEIYDGHCTANWLDIAGLKITDGPDWIGGDSGGDTTAPTVTISTADPSSITSDSLSISGTASDAAGVTSVT